MSRPPNQFSRPLPMSRSPGGIPLIGEGPVAIPGFVQTYPHWSAEPITMELPGVAQGTEGGQKQVMVKHVWGGLSKRLKLAAPIAAQLAPLIGNSIDNEEDCARRALNLADALLIADYEDAEAAKRMAQEDAAKAQERSADAVDGTPELPRP